MQYVSVGMRAVAVIIDTIVLFIVGYAIASFTGDTTSEGFELTGAPAFALILIFFMYYIVLEATLGATLGKLALGLRVVKSNGSPLDWPASIVRNLLRIVDGLVFYILGAILVWTSPKRQRLGYRVADTVVIRKAAVV